MRNWFYFLILLLPFTLNADEKKAPFYVTVDFSKKGTVYETDFQAPWNIWGSWVEFYLLVRHPYDKVDDENYQIERMIDYGYGADGKKISEDHNVFFKLKVTLTPLGWASDDIKIRILKPTGWIKKELKNIEKIEEIVTIPLYGSFTQSGIKYIMLADLQRLSRYHIKVESLEDVELPNGTTNIRFGINRYSSKH